MKVTAKILIQPQTAYDIARRMRGIEPKELEPKTWYKFLKSEHSPIRIATYEVYMENIPAWVSVHFTRHKVGVEHFVTTNRADLTGKERTADATVNHTMVINAQALITMARKRLCYKAAEETREVMDEVWTSIQDIDSRLAMAMVPDCIYRGKCNEFKPCGMME